MWLLFPLSSMSCFYHFISSVVSCRFRFVSIFIFRPKCNNSSSRPHQQSSAHTHTHTLFYSPPGWYTSIYTYSLLIKLHTFLFMAQIRWNSASDILGKCDRHYQRCYSTKFCMHVQIVCVWWQRERERELQIEFVFVVIFFLCFWCPRT